MEFWVWYGGRPAVDLVNTRRARADRGVEYLRDADDLTGWLVAAGHPGGSVDERVFHEAIALREAIDDGIRAAVDGVAPPAAALATLNGWLAASPPPTLAIDGVVAVLRPGIPDGPRQALHAIALDAAALLGTADRDLLRICPGPRCGGRFVDTSPARRRRWCSMAICGNRAKVARHREAASS